MGIPCIHYGTEQQFDSGGRERLRSGQLRPGVRAGLIHDHFSARQGVQDDHMNIICMGGRTVGPAVAWDLVQTFLTNEFSQAERHLRRLSKVASLEAQAISEVRKI